MIRNRISPSISSPSTPTPESEALLLPPIDSNSSPINNANSRWILLAAMSGLTAATNGVFAKLSTTGLTGSIATSLAAFLGLTNHLKPFEVVLRITFFVLNLVFNGIMWALFTRALAAGNSTTQVSMINTSTNFMATALMGWIVFSEALPLMWWVGASFLAVGNVIIGRKDEGVVESGQETETMKNGRTGDIST